MAARPTRPPEADIEHVTTFGLRAAGLIVAVLPLTALAASLLPSHVILKGEAAAEPVANAAFAPPPGAHAAPPFSGRLEIRQATLRTRPAIDKPLQDGRDAGLLPAVSLEFFTVDDLLVPVERGEMVRERGVAKASFWRVIPQIGRIWHESADGGWSRAAFPLMLVNDTDNDARQGLAIFLYQGSKVSGLMFQFPQQNAPYLLGRPFIAWGATALTYHAGDPAKLAAWQEQARAELKRRLPAKPWRVLLSALAPGALDGFGGPLSPEHRVLAALERDGTLYYQQAETVLGVYPYPLEMRFGTRSIMKSVGTPLALLHLAQLYGPWVLNLKIGDYVQGLDAKWQQVRFIDAANMSSGLGGTGSLTTNPNDSLSGYTEGDYDGWYTAPSHAEKVAKIAGWKAYPWAPGTVMRYRDQDFYLAGAALDGFLKSVRGPAADIWSMLIEEVFKPIGIAHAPAVRTREPDGRDGMIWFNAGFYPTLDDLAKIAMLYQNKGRYAEQQLLHAGLTEDLLNARGALQKEGDASRPAPGERPAGAEYYLMGLHFNPYVGSASHRRFDLPTMSGYGGNEVTLFPNGAISLVLGNLSSFDPGQQVNSQLGPQTLRAVDRLSPF